MRFNGAKGGAVMADRPIQFSPPMVCALLAETKTQTRRVVTPQPAEWEARVIDISKPFFNEDEDAWGQIETIWPRGATWEPEYEEWRPLKSIRYRVGDRLYVREAWKTHAAYDDISPSAMGGDEAIQYEADGAHQTWGYPAISKIGRFRQGMHMPRWASRLTLIVTDVRVQRLHEISEADAEAEGCEPILVPPDGGSAPHVEGYRVLWDSLNADRGFGWKANPWVVAVSFVVVYCNIDEAA